MVKNAFLLKHAEKADHNQYWFSQITIETLVKEIEQVAIKVAFLSTPSVYFSLAKGTDVKNNSWVFDFDDQWANDKHYVRYDFNAPDSVPEELHHTFDLVVIDPPFITEDVWRKYAATAKLLLNDNGKVIASTVIENQELLGSLFDAKPCAFKPSVPNLVYQYNFFTNYEPALLQNKNSEIPDDD